MNTQPSAADSIQASRVLRLHSPLGENVLLPERVHISEGVNQPSKIEVAVRSVRLMAFVLAAFAFSHAAKAEGFDLSLLRSPLKLNAIPKSDSGKNIGMIATLTNDRLEYKAINGKFLLSPYGKFDLQKLLPRYQPVYKSADGAFIYTIQNWKEIADSNKDYIYIKAGQIPMYVYTYKGKYVPTGQPGIFVCLVSNPDFENFYQTAAGHMRCDVFKNK